MNERKAFSIPQVVKQCQHEVGEMMARFGSVHTNDIMMMLHRAQVREGFLTSVYYKDGMFYVEHETRKGN